MKALINKLLLLVICTSALVIVAPVTNAQSVAQLEEKTLPVGEFSSVSVTDDFNVTLVKGTYSVRLTTDKVLAPYVQVYVRSKVLYITYDEKSLPKDLKKEYKKKGAPKPVFRAVVSLPELNGITLSENASLSSTDEFRGSSFSMNLQEKAQVKGLKVQVSTAQVNLKKNSQATFDLVCDQKAEIVAEGNAMLTLSVSAPEAVLTTSNSANVTITCDAPEFTVNTAGSSKVTASGKNVNTRLKMSNSSDLILSGETENLDFVSEKSAELEAVNYATLRMNANMSGGKANVQVAEELTVSLTGGSALYYSETPVFKIGKIIKSTLAPVGTTK